MTGEPEFLEAYSAEAFDRPSVAVDVALITISDDSLAVLLIERTEHPHQGRWQLPGGFVAIDESLDAAAARVLRDKANIEDIYTEQLYTFGSPDRDPRTRVISIGYYTLVDPSRVEVSGDRTLLAEIDVPWEGETGGAVGLRKGSRSLDIAFDHREFVGLAVKRLRGKLDYTPVGYQLLADEFTLLDLQRIHEIILGRSLNKDSFRRRMLASGDLEPTGRQQKDVDHRPAALYRIAPDRRPGLGP